MSADRPHHTADSEQSSQEEGFAAGQADPEEFPQDQRVGTFAEGQEGLDDDDRRKGRFSEGQEELGEDDPEKHVQGRFDEGQDDEWPRSAGPARRAERDRARSPRQARSRRAA
jgi:hypothetical protein